MGAYRVAVANRRRRTVQPGFDPTSTALAN
jgi:hypothetical protein